MVSIDLDDIEKEGQSLIAPTKQKVLPKSVAKLVNKEKNTGVVYISKLDKIKIKTPRGFTKQTEVYLHLQLIYREYLDTSLIMTMNMEGKEILLFT